MRSLAESLRRDVGAQEGLDHERVIPLDEEEVTAAIEGGASYVLTLRRERSRSLRRRKLTQIAAAGEAFSCEVCGFNFEATYGERGRQYIEVHHRTPLHASGQTESSISDLALLCANCHRIIHRRDWISVEELGNLIKTGEHRQS
ncbi:HNH endonuclease [Demequina flava]|uniref:HNH endonuclease n=1 Tax=Demequina flava TaxID=1095025 RepID=UPI000A8E7C15